MRKSRKAGLRLDQPDSATKPAESGKTAVVPNKSADSELLRRILSADSDEQMPPASENKSLSAAQKETLKRWIEQGATFEQHWSFRSVTRPSLPAVKNKAWPKTAIDQFILVRLEAEGLSPSPEAERETLIRRVTLDLTGLPPTIAEIDAFLNDRAANAYEKVVDRLLKSPHYGERMGARLAGCVTLCRYERLSHRQRPRHDALGASGSSTPSIATCRLINSRSSSWPAICCRSRPIPPPRSSRNWPADSIATT